MREEKSVSKLQDKCHPNVSHPNYEIKAFSDNADVDLSIAAYLKKLKNVITIIDL